MPGDEAGWSNLATPPSSLSFEHVDLQIGELNDIAHDRQGLLWLATSEGLLRYDGFEHRAFRPPGTSLGDVVAVKHLLIADDGRLWAVGERGRVIVLETRTEAFRIIDLNDVSDTNVRTLGIAQALDGTVWVGSWSNGVYAIDPESYETRHRSLADLLGEAISDTSIHGLTPHPQGGVWATTSSVGLLRIPGIDDDVLRIPLMPERAADNQPFVSLASYGPDGRLYLGTFQVGLRRLDASEKQIDGDWLPPPDCDFGFGIVGMANAEQSLWVATEGGGLLRLDPAEGTCHASRFNSASPNGLASDHIHVMHFDDDRRMWLGSASILSRSDLGEGRFEHYRHRPGDPSSLWDNETHAILEDQQGRLFVGSDKGISRFTPGDKGFTRISVDGHRVLSLAAWGAETVLAGTTDGLYTLGSDALYVEPLTRVSDTLTTPKSRYVLSMLVDRSGTLWVGTIEGLVRWDPLRDSVTRFRAGPEAGSLPHDMVRVIYEDAAGQLWVGTAGGGLAAFDRNTQLFRSVPAETDGPDALGSRNIAALSEDTDGRLWVSTNNGKGGIHRFDPTTGHVELWGYAEGVPRAVHGALPEETGIVWLSTERGIMRLDSGSDRLELYPEIDNVEYRGTIPTALHRGPSGRMYFGSASGITAFDPSGLSTTTVPARVWITGVYVDGDVLSPLSAPGRYGMQTASLFRPELTFRHDDRQVRFSFGGIAAGGTQHIRFEHRLLGLHDNWIESGSERRFAEYTTLPAGEYQFQIRAAGVRGPWSEPQSAVFSVLRAPWLTHAALAAYAVMFLTASFLIFRVRSQALRSQAIALAQAVEDRTSEVARQREELAEQAQRLAEKSDDLEELVAEKNRVYLSLSHELRTPITLVSNPIRMILDRLQGDSAVSRDELLNRLTNIRENTDRLNDLVEQLLKLSYLRHVDEHREPLNASDALRNLIERFQQRARDNGLQLLWQPGQEHDIWCRMIPDALDVIASNLISNAIKYTHSPGTVTVRLDASDAEIALHVEDTGVGIAPELVETVWDRFVRAPNSIGAPGSGLGLAVVRELTQKHGGSVAVDSVPGKGSCFTVRLPWENYEPPPQTQPTPRGSQASDEDSHTRERPLALVVDDDAGMRDLVVEVLRDEFDCIVAIDGEEGLMMAVNEMPDIIVSDVGMPKLDGYHLSRALKSRSETSHIPLVLLTAHADRDSRKRGLMEEADDYIAKPFDGEELRLRLRNLLRQRDRLRDHYQQKFAKAPDEPEIADRPAESPQERRNQAFLEQLRHSIEADFANPQLNVKELALRLSLTPRQLHRKTVCLLGRAPLDLLRAHRLAVAKDKLRDGQPVKAVAYDVGFSSPAAFSKAFKAEFGIAPAHWAVHAGDRRGD